MLHAFAVCLERPMRKKQMKFKTGLDAILVTVGTTGFVLVLSPSLRVFSVMLVFEIYMSIVYNILS